MSGGLDNAELHGSALLPPMRTVVRYRRERERERAIACGVIAAGRERR